MSDGIAPANPAVNHTQSVERLGSDATGTESAAQDFTDFLREEEKPDPQSRPARRERAAKRTQEADGDGDGTADEGQGRERQPKGERSERRQEDGDGPDEADPLHDPILDGDAPEEDGDKSDDDADEDADEADPEAKDDDDEEGDDDPEFEVTVNGEKQSVKQSELLASYSREADYRQKTEAHARDVEQVHEFATALSERRTQVDTLVQMSEDFIASLMPTEAEWAALKAADPKAFIAAQEQWTGYINKASALKSARDEVLGQQTEENTVAQNRYIKEQNRLLFEKVPQLKNPKVQKQFSEKIHAYGKRMGYTSEELIKGLVNHRDVQTAYYAARYLEILDSRKANAKQAAKKGPRQSEGNSTPKTPQTQRGRDNSRRMNRQRDADRELQRTGSPQSAAKAFAEMFRD